MCINSNILDSGSVVQEEATQIAEKLEISDFVASNGCLEKFKQKYSMCNKTVTGEAGDVIKEMTESWNEHAREITTGWNARNVWSMDETSCFSHGLPKKTRHEGKTVHWREKGDAMTNMGIFCQSRREEGRSCCYWQVRQSEMLLELTVTKLAMLLFHQ